MLSIDSYNEFLCIFGCSRLRDTTWVGQIWIFDSYIECLYLYLIGVGASSVGRSHQHHAMEPLVLYLDPDVQLSVLVPNFLVGAANVDIGAERH